MPAVTYHFLTLAHFNSEDGGSMFLRIICSHMIDYKWTPRIFHIGEEADREAVSFIFHFKNFNKNPVKI
jgi:hypothetical protein